jgi:uncharacterized membrane protein
MEHTQREEFHIETTLGNLLRAGVTIAAAVVIAGAVVYLSRHGAEAPAYRVFRGEPADLRSIGGIWREVLALRGRGLIQFGLLLLIATPIARVAFSVYAFARERDTRYVVITLVVLALLACSLIGSAR